MAGAAADVGDVDARLEALDEPRNDGKGLVDERCVEDRPRLVVELLLEARISGVGHAAAVSEALDDLALDAPDQREVGRDRGDVVRPRRPCE